MPRDAKEHTIAKARRTKAMAIASLTLELQFGRITIAEFRAKVRDLNAAKAPVVKAPKGFFEGKRKGKR